MSTSSILVDERTRRATSAIAAFVALIAISALTGWATGSDFLVRLLASFPPLHVATALGLLGMAAGLHGLGSGRWSLVFGGTAVALLIGGASLVEYIWNISLWVSPRALEGTELDFWATGRIEVASALSLVLVGVALLALSSQRWPRAGTITAATLGSLVAILSITILFTYSTDVLAGLRASHVTGIAVHAAVAFAAMGICVVMIAWQRDPGADMLPNWAPVAVGVSTLVTTVILWRTLRLVEHERAGSLLREYAVVAQRELVRRLDGSVRELQQLGIALRQQPAPRLDLDSATDALLPNPPAVAGFGWMDSTLAVQALFAARALIAPDLMSLQAFVNREHNVVSRAIRAMLPVVRVVPGRSEPPWLLVVAPLCDGPPCRSAVFGVLQPYVLLRPALAVALPGYDVSIRANQTAIYNPVDSEGTSHEPWTGRSAITAYGIRWHVVARPSASLMPLFRSDLPKVVAGLGLIVSVLLATTTRLVQTRLATTRLAERKRLAAALEGATDGLWELNVVSGEATRSPSLWRRLGYDAAGIDPHDSGARWAALVHPEQRDAVALELQKLLAGSTESFEIEYGIRASDGDWHWMVERGRVAERDAQGRPVRLLGICADVTDRKHADQAVADSERRFRAVFDGGFQFQSLLDLDCRLLEANRRSLEFVGVDHQAVRGAFLWDTPWWREDTACQDRLRQACAEAAQGRAVRYQEQIRGRGDNRAIVDLSLTPIVDAEGRVLQLLAEGRDITELKRAEDAMREMDTLSTMGRLAARIAHEINNPLAGIQNSFLLIKDAVPVTHPYHAYVGAIEREIARIAGVTRQLYETYRPEGDATAESSVVLVISDAVRMLEQVNRASQVTISVNTAGAPTVLPIPSALLRQAVYNLVQNAVEASPPGETVTVRAWMEDGAFWLSVRDRGPGVPSDLRERIFEPFVSTKGELATAGMGLGLSLVRKSVQALGGRIEIHDPEGGGAEFRIRLPLSRHLPRA
jgi:PAS domain S-box-containing protein